MILWGDRPPGGPYIFLLRRRRGIHSLVAVSMLTGFAVMVSGALLAVLSDYGEISTHGAQCTVSGATLHSTGDGMAYFVAGIRNMGSGTVTAANVTFTDDHGVSYGFASDALSVPPGQVWDESGSFPASVSGTGDYPIRATAAFDDGSITVCFV